MCDIVWMLVWLSFRPDFFRHEKLVKIVVARKMSLWFETEPLLVLCAILVGSSFLCQHLMDHLVVSCICYFFIIFSSVANCSVPWHLINLPDEHIPYYFFTRPKLKNICRQSADCPYLVCGVAIICHYLVLYDMIICLVVNAFFTVHHYLLCC